MWKEIIAVCLILSVVVISGCLQTGPANTVSTQAEDQAMNEIEQEMEKAIDNIDLEEIENLLLT